MVSFELFQQMSVRKTPAIVVALKGAGHFGVSRLCNKWQIICKSCSFLSYSLLWHVLIGICCALCLGPVVYGTPFCLQWNIMLWTSFISLLHLVLSLSVSPRHFAPSVFVFSDNEGRNLYKGVMWQKISSLYFCTRNRSRSQAIVLCFLQLHIIYLKLFCVHGQEHKICLSGETYLIHGVQLIYFIQQILKVHAQNVAQHAMVTHILPGVFVFPSPYCS